MSHYLGYSNMVEAWGGTYNTGEIPGASDILGYLGLPVGHADCPVLGSAFEALRLAISLQRAGLGLPTQDTVGWAMGVIYNHAATHNIEAAAVVGAAAVHSYTVH